MAHSREVRLPFLSHKLVEFVFSLPDDYLIRDGWTKYIHRKALESNLPSKVCWRVDKIGYETPQENWLNSNEVNDNLHSKCSGCFRTETNRMSHANAILSLTFEIVFFELEVQITESDLSKTRSNQNCQNSKCTVI